MSPTSASLRTRRLRERFTWHSVVSCSGTLGRERFYKFTMVHLRDVNRKQFLGEVLGKSTWRVSSNIYCNKSLKSQLPEAFIRAFNQLRDYRIIWTYSGRALEEKVQLKLLANYFHPFLVISQLFLSIFKRFWSSHLRQTCDECNPINPHRNLSTVFASCKKRCKWLWLLITW